MSEPSVDRLKAMYASDCREFASQQRSANLQLTGRPSPNVLVPELNPRRERIWQQYVDLLERGVAALELRVIREEAER